MPGNKNHYTVSSPDITARMRRIKSRGTGLELAMEQILHSIHIRFKRQPDLLGHPDFQIRGTSILIFCDSSFWHGRRPKELDGTAFSSNKQLWIEKLQANKKRDARISRALRRQGWSVQRFWDTDILYNPDKVKARLKRALCNPKAMSRSV